MDHNLNWTSKWMYIQSLGVSIHIWVIWAVITPVERSRKGLCRTLLHCLPEWVFGEWKPVHVYRPKRCFSFWMSITFVLLSIWDAVVSRDDACLCMRPTVGSLAALDVSHNHTLGLLMNLRLELHHLQTSGGFQIELLDCVQRKVNEL